MSLAGVLAGQATAADGPQTRILDGVTVTLPNQGDDPKVMIRENMAIDCVDGTISVAPKVDLSGDVRLLTVNAPAGQVVLAVSVKSGSNWTLSVTFSGSSATVVTSQGISNYVVVTCVREDNTPPGCVLTGIGFDANGKKYIQVTVQDPEAGIASITPVVSNASVSIDPDPYAGTTAPVLVTATKIDQTQGSFLQLTISNGLGARTTCDPPVPAVKATPHRGKALPAANASLRATPRVPTYGQTITLAGKAPSGRRGETVSIYAQACGFTAPVRVATVRTGKGGAYAFRVDAMINTTFTARVGSTSTTPALVRVKPKLVLKRVGAGQFRAEAFTTNGQFLDGRAFEMERAVGNRWELVTQEVLERASSPFEMTLTSALTFRADVPAGSKVRIRMTRHEATCYDSAASATVTT